MNNMIPTKTTGDTSYKSLKIPKG